MRRTTFKRRPRKVQPRRDNVGRLVRATRDPRPGYLLYRPQDVGTGGVSFYDSIPRATVPDGADLR